MKTTMNIPDELLREAIEASQASTQTMAVVMGLQELVRKKRLKELMSLRGSGIVGLPVSGHRKSRKR